MGSFCPRIDAQWYDAVVVRRGMPFLSLAEIRAILACDLVVWGGGGILLEQSCLSALPYWTCVLLFIRHVLRRPVIAWAHGISLQSRRGRFLAAKALGAANLVTVRDEHSLAQAESLGIRAKKIIEPVCLLAPADRVRTTSILEEEGIPTDRKLVAVCPSYWSFDNRPDDILPYLAARKMRLRRREHSCLKTMNRTLAEIADGLCDRLDADIVLLPHYPDRLWKDQERLEEIRKNASCAKRMHILKGDTYSPQEYLGLFRHFVLSIAMPMHEGMFSLMMGTPCLQLFYEKKGEELFRAAGAEQCAIDWNILWQTNGTNAVLFHAERILRSWATLGPDVDRRLGAMRNAAAATVDLLNSVLTHERSVDA